MNTSSSSSWPITATATVRTATTIMANGNSHNGHYYHYKPQHHQHHQHQPQQLNHINVRCLCYVLLAIYTLWTECFTRFGVDAAIDAAATASIAAGHVSTAQHTTTTSSSSHHHQHQHHSHHPHQVHSAANDAQQPSATSQSPSAAQQQQYHFNGREPLRLDGTASASGGSTPTLTPQFNVDHLVRQHYNSDGATGSQALAAQHLHFEPSELTFAELSMGNSRTEKVMLFNRHPNQSVYIGPIAGVLPDFYSSFFRDEVKIVQPLGNTTFNVVFLPRQVGAIATALHVHTSFGVGVFQLRGSAVVCPFRLQPLVGIRAPLNATLAPEIRMYNPFEQPLHVLEVFTSGGEFQLEMPRGRVEGMQGLWQIPAFTERAVVRVRFHAFQSGWHAAYVRIIVLVDEESDAAGMELVVPIEIEVTDLPGGSLFLEQPLLNFGRGGRSDKPKRLLINLTGTDLESLEQSATFPTAGPTVAVPSDTVPSIQSFAIEGDAGLVDAITLRLHKSAASVASAQRHETPLTTAKRTKRTTTTASAEPTEPTAPSVGGSDVSLDERSTTTDTMSATLDWSMLSKQQQIYRGHIAIRTLLSNNREANLRIALVAEALDGAMFYNESHTQFVTPTRKAAAADASDSAATRNGAAKAVAQQRPFVIRNDFAVPLAITNVTLSADASPYFRLSDVSSLLLAPGSESAIARIGLQAAALQQRHAVAGHMMVHTNASVYAVRLSTYDGRLRRIVPVDERTHSGRGVDEQMINYGTLPLSTVTDTVVAFVNDNPVPVTLHNWTATISEAASIFVLLRGCGQLSMDSLKFCYNVQPGEWIVFQVSVLSNAVGTFVGRLTMKTDFEELLTPVQFSTAVGRLQITAAETHVQDCFPGGLCSLNLTAHSTFAQPISVSDIQVNVTDDIRYDYSATLLRHLLPIAPHQITPVVLLHFLPRALCGDECAVQLPDRWAPSVISHNCKHQLPDLMHDKLQEFRRIRAAFAALAVRVQTNQVRRYDLNATVTMLWPKLVALPAHGGGGGASTHRQHQHQQQRQQRGLQQQPPRRVNLIEANAFEPDAYDDNVNGDPFGDGPADEGSDSPFDRAALPFLRTGPVEFPTFQVGEEVLRIVEIANPSDRPIGVHLMLHDMARHGAAMSFPPEVVSQCWDCFLSREPVFALLDTATVRPAEVQVIAPHASLHVTIRFSATTAGTYSTLLYVRNNFTILEVVWLTAKAAAHQFKFGNRKPGSDTPLVFELTDKHFRDCDRGHSVHGSSTSSSEYPVHPVTPIMEEMMQALGAGFGLDEGAGDGSFDGGADAELLLGGAGGSGASSTAATAATSPPPGSSSSSSSGADAEPDPYAGRVRVVAKRTFTAKNTGDMAIDIYGMYIEGIKCAGYGFKVMNCWNFRLPPDTSKKIDITFTPDFTLARVTRVLSIETSLNYAINYTLLSLVPAQALNTCGKAIRRPVWEAHMHLATFLILGIALLLVVCVSFFEADRVLKLHVYNVSRDRGPMEPPLNLRDVGLRNPQAALCAEDAASAVAGSGRPLTNGSSSSSSNGAKSKSALSAYLRKRNNKRQEAPDQHGSAHQQASATKSWSEVLARKFSPIKSDVKFRDISPPAAAGNAAAAAAAAVPNSSNNRGADRKADSAAKRNVVAMMDANLPVSVTTTPSTASSTTAAASSPSSSSNRSNTEQSTKSPSTSSCTSTLSPSGSATASPPTLVTKQARSTSTTAATPKQKQLHFATESSGVATSAAASAASASPAIASPSSYSTCIGTPTSTPSSLAAAASNHSTNGKQGKTRAAVKKTKSLPLQSAPMAVTPASKDAAPTPNDGANAESQTANNAKVGKQHTTTEPTPKQHNYKANNASNVLGIQNHSNSGTNKSSNANHHSDSTLSSDKTHKPSAGSSGSNNNSHSRAKESPAKDNQPSIVVLSAPPAVDAGAAAAHPKVSTASSSASSTSSSASSLSEADKHAAPVSPAAAAGAAVPAKKYGKTPGRERRKEQQNAAAAVQPVTRKQNLSNMLLLSSNDQHHARQSHSNSNAVYKHSAFQFGAPLSLANVAASATAPMQPINFAAPPSSSLAAAASTLWDMNRTSFSNVVAQSSLLAAASSVANHQPPSSGIGIGNSSISGNDNHNHSANIRAGAGPNENNATGTDVSVGLQLSSSVIDDLKPSDSDAKPAQSSLASGTNSTDASMVSSYLSTSAHSSASTSSFNPASVSENTAISVALPTAASAAATGQIAPSAGARSDVTSSSSAPSPAHSATTSTADPTNLSLRQGAARRSNVGADEKAVAAAVDSGFVSDTILTGVDLGPIGTRKSPAQTPVVWEPMQASVHRPLAQNMPPHHQQQHGQQQQQRNNANSSSGSNAGSMLSMSNSSNHNATDNTNASSASNMANGVGAGSTSDTNSIFNPNSFFSSNFPKCDREANAAGSNNTQNANNNSVVSNSNATVSASLFDVGQPIPAVTSAPAAAVVSVATASSRQSAENLSMSQFGDLFANTRNIGFGAKPTNVWETPIASLSMLNESDLNNSRQQQQQQQQLQLRQQQQQQQMQQLQQQQHQQQQLLLQHQQQQQMQNEAAAQAHQQSASAASQLSNTFGTLGGLLNANQFGQAAGMNNAFGGHLNQQQSLQQQQQQQQQQLLHQQQQQMQYGSGAATTSSFDANHLWTSNYNASNMTAASTASAPIQLNTWTAAAAAANMLLQQESAMQSGATIRPPPGLERQPYPNRLFNQQLLLQQHLQQQQYMQQQEHQQQQQQHQLQHQLQPLNATESLLLFQHTLLQQQQQQQQNNNINHSSNVNNMLSDNAIIFGSGPASSSSLAIGRGNSHNHNTHNHNGNAIGSRSAIAVNHAINDGNGGGIASGEGGSAGSSNMYNTFGSIWSPPGSWDTPLRPSTSSASLNSTHSSTRSSTGAGGGIGGTGPAASPPPPPTSAPPTASDYNSRMQ